ncbi:CBS domain-containing protein [Streptomyces sp. NBC_01465]|uniref:CBS domain-containing protein n=1 Tax=Streptomyces sp. NBC_01465 TaxID=2903878 RepID=UPI002E319D70|nr:CBS domain-containing protein [Streptomyces sp. NBC_01465]
MYPGPQTVSDVMTHTVIAVGREATFKDIVHRLQQWKISALPVLEGEGRVIGVVSEADLIPKEAFHDSDPGRLGELRSLTDLTKADGLTAGQLMTAPATTIHASATLAQAARVMARRAVKRLPVVNSEALLEGIVSRSDLLTVFLRSDEELAEEIRHSVLSALAPHTTTPIVVDVHDGIAYLTGTVQDTNLIPLATRLARAVEGIVDVRSALTNGHPTAH